MDSPLIGNTRAYSKSLTFLGFRILWLTEITVCVLVRDDGTTRSTHKKPKEDTFGQNDEDWMVYRSIVSE